MSLNHAPPAALAQEMSEDTVLWLHAAFCELGGPIRGARGNWHREIGTAALRIEPNSAEHAVPSGRMLRLCLMHICDTAVRTQGVTLDLGESATPLADQMQAGGRVLDLIEQMHRLLAAKVSISIGGGAEIPVFDARSRSRGESAEWRPSVRLSSKFLASLADHAIALDRVVLRQLFDSPLALDAYAWIRLSLSSASADRTLTTSWADLLKRFGTTSQGTETFREAFETALRLVFDADRSIALAVDDDGVSVRHAEPEDDQVKPAVAPPEVARVQAPGPPVTREEASPLAPLPELSPGPLAAPTPASAAGRKPGVSKRPDPQAPAAAQASANTAPAADQITQDSICLPRHSTGLSQGLWLRRGHGEERVLIGVTPGTRMEPDRLTVLAVEPMVLQVSGGLYQQDFDRVSAWIMSNRDLIDDFWSGQITSFEEVGRRVRKAPALGSR